MSAESVHAGVQKEMKKVPGGNVCDFQDFGNVIRNSNGEKMGSSRAAKRTRISMDCSDFGIKIKSKRTTDRFPIKLH